MAADPEVVARGLAFLDSKRRRVDKVAESAIELLDDDGEPLLVELTEDALARAFAQRYRGRLLYNHTRGRWMVWDGARWKPEETRLAFEWIRQLARSMNRAGEAKWSKASVCSAVELFAQSDREFAVTGEVFDCDPWLLGTPAGVVDLRTGATHPCDPGWRMSKVAGCAVAPEGARPERWLQFLEQATQGDQGLIRFLQQVLGYSLTGLTIEHLLLFVYGPGGNGKSVFLDTAAGVMGEYAQAADMRVFTEAKHERHPTELAALNGARLVTASETERNATWAESRIKQLTGGDVIRARFMRQDEFQFTPQFQLVIVGNHKPRIQSVDDAMRRRLCIVNFNHQPAERNPLLREQLRAEWPAILRWMVDGCLDWQASGLVRPKVVDDATAEYFAEQDTFRMWIEECCELGPRFLAGATELFRSWQEFAKAAGEDPGSQKSFGAEIVRADFRRDRDAAGRTVWRGLRLKTGPATSDPRLPREWDVG